MDTANPVEEFIAALPPHAQRDTHHTAALDHYIHRAIDRGWTPRQLATRCTGDLGVNPGATITHRLARDSQAPPPAGGVDPTARRIPFCTPECRDNAGWILNDHGQPARRCECRTAG